MNTYCKYLACPIHNSVILVLFVSGTLLHEVKSRIDKNHTRKDQFSYGKTRIFLNICSDNGLLKRAFFLELKRVAWHFVAALLNTILLPHRSIGFIINHVLGHPVFKMMMI